MGKILNSILKAVSAAAGPAGGFVGEGFLRYIDEQQAEKTDQKLEDILKSNETIKDEVLVEVLAGLDGIQNDLSLFIQQLKYAIQELQDEFHSQPIQLIDKPPEEIADYFEKTLSQRQNYLISKGFVTEEVIHEELLKLYGADVDDFISAIQITGFPVGRIKSRNMNIAAHSFLQTCKGQSAETLSKVFNKLAEIHPGSDVLKVSEANIKFYMPASSNNK